MTEIIRYRADGQKFRIMPPDHIFKVNPHASSATTISKKTLHTEDTGKIFEMAICLAYGIPYNGKYKYGMEEPEKLKARLQNLLNYFQFVFIPQKKARDTIIPVYPTKQNIFRQKQRKKAWERLLLKL